MFVFFLFLKIFLRKPEMDFASKLKFIACFSFNARAPIIDLEKVLRCFVGKTVLQSLRLSSLRPREIFKKITLTAERFFCKKKFSYYWICYFFDATRYLRKISCGSSKAVMGTRRYLNAFQNDTFLKTFFWLL